MEPRQSAPVRPDPRPLHVAVRVLPAYLEATGIVIVSTGIAAVVHRYLPHASLSLAFLVGVLAVAARSGLGPALFASLLSFQAFNFFFTPPYYTFAVAEGGDVVTLVFFLLVAAIGGWLAGRMHREIANRRVSLQRLSDLHGFSRQMASAVRPEDVHAALATHLNTCIGAPAAVLGGRAGTQTRVLALAGCEDSDLASLPQGPDQAADPTQAHGWLLLWLASRRCPGIVVALAGELDAGQLELARSLCEQAAVALDRTELTAELEDARLESETERLRSALLSSVSHDLRTPLASIIGSATSLAAYRESLSEEDQQDLLDTVIGESRRLDRYIQNLLDMTRLGEGRLSLRRDWVDLHDIVAAARERLREGLAPLRLDVQIAADVPLLWVHGVLLEQALVNVLDNAIRFSPPGGRIEVRACRDGEAVGIDICDEGPGIPEAEREKVFDMFYVVRGGDRRGGEGTGLGLAICRGMVGAHGGTVTALPGRDGRGTCFRIRLPLLEPGGEGVE